jgi:hypothetical protein
MQVLQDSGLGLQSLWDVRAEGQACGNGEEPAQPEDVFTTWKFRGEGEVRRIIDYIWCAGPEPRLDGSTPLHWREKSRTEEMHPCGVLHRSGCLTGFHLLIKGGTGQLSDSTIHRCKCVSRLLCQECTFAVSFSTLRAAFFSPGERLNLQVWELSSETRAQRPMP